MPTLAEWNDLVNYLGGDAVAGGKLKEAEALSWTPPNTGATNEIGFAAPPGGMSNTSTQVNWGFSGKREGLSVRCILD